MKHKIVTVFLTFLLLCTGCGAKGDAAPPEVPQEAPPAPAAPAPAAPEPSEEEDHVLMAMELPQNASRNALTCHAIGKKREGAEQWGVREIQVFDGDALVQTLSVQDAIDTDGVSGALGEGYTDCPAVNELMHALDMNFDGFLDLALFAWTPAGGNIPQYYWLWDEGEGAFRYGFCLPNAVVDDENQQIICTTNQTRGFSSEYYAYDDQGALQLVYSVSEMHQPDGTLLREAYRLVDGKLVQEE